MQVHVRLVSPMPHNIEVCVKDRPDAFIINVDKTLSAERQAQVLEAAFNMTIEHWRRIPNPNGTGGPHLHTG